MLNLPVRVFFVVTLFLSCGLFAGYAYDCENEIPPAEGKYIDLVADYGDAGFPEDFVIDEDTVVYIRRTPAAGVVAAGRVLTIGYDLNEETVGEGDESLTTVIYNAPKVTFVIGPNVNFDVYGQLFVQTYDNTIKPLVDAYQENPDGSPLPLPKEGGLESPEIKFTGCDGADNWGAVRFLSTSGQNVASQLDLSSNNDKPGTCIFERAGSPSSTQGFSNLNLPASCLVVRSNDHTIGNVRFGSDCTGVAVLHELPLRSKTGRLYKDEVGDDFVDAQAYSSFVAPITFIYEYLDIRSTNPLEEEDLILNHYLPQDTIVADFGELFVRLSGYNLYLGKDSSLLCLSKTRLRDCLITSPKEDEKWGRIEFLATVGCQMLNVEIEQSHGKRESESLLNLQADYPVTQNLPQFSVLLTSTESHTLENVTFRNFEGVPLLWGEPYHFDVRNIIIDQPHIPEDNQISAIAIADVTSTVTMIESTEMSLSTIGNVERYYFPQDTQFEEMFKTDDESGMLTFYANTDRFLRCQGPVQVKNATFTSLEYEDRPFWGRIELLDTLEEETSFIENCNFRYIRGGRDSAEYPNDLNDWNITQSPTIGGVAPLSNFGILVGSIDCYITNVTFDSFEGVPILLNPPLIQRLSNLSTYQEHDLEGNRLNMIAIAHHDERLLTSVRSGETVIANANNHGDPNNMRFLGYYFPLSISFEPEASLRAVGSGTGTDFYFNEGKRMICSGTTTLQGIKLQGLRGTGWTRAEFLSDVPALLQDLVFSGLTGILQEGEEDYPVSKDYIYGLGVILSSQPHDLRNIHFMDYQGVPLMLMPPLRQNLDALTYDQTENRPQIINAIAVSGPEQETIVSSGEVNLRVVGDFVHYFFPQHTTFQSQCSFTSDGVSVYVNREKLVRSEGICELSNTEFQAVTDSPPDRWGRFELMQQDLSAQLDGVTFKHINGSTPERQITGRLPAHAIYATSNPHILRNIRLEEFDGVPLLLQMPIYDQNGDRIVTLENWTLQRDHTWPIDLNAIAFGDQDASQTFVFEGPTEIKPWPTGLHEFDKFAFPQDVVFADNAGLTVSQGMEIYFGSTTYVRLTGPTEILGTIDEPIVINSIEKNKPWGHIELIGKQSPAVLENVIIQNSGGMAPVPAFSVVTETERQYIGDGRYTLGSAIVLSENTHRVANITFIGHQQLPISQDLNFSPVYDGAFTFIDPAPNSVQAIGLFDFRIDKQNLPLIIEKSRTLQPVGVKSLPLGNFLPYYIDRDLMVPPLVDLELRSLAGPLERLHLMFSPQEPFGWNFNSGKCELLVAGSLATKASENNRVLLEPSEMIATLPIVNKSSKLSAETSIEMATEELSAQLLGYELDEFIESAKTFQEMQELKGQKSSKNDEDKAPVAIASTWSGMFLLNRADDYKTNIDSVHVKKAINGITYRRSAPNLTNSIVEDSLNSAVVITDNAFPTIEKNIFRNNGGSGLVCRGNSSPLISNNLITGNKDGNGVTISEYSSPILVRNTITDNNVGVSIATGSTPNLGRFLYSEGLDEPVVPGAVGFNNISNNYNKNGYILNLINNTPNDIYAQNNSWGLSDTSQIDATIWDNDESGQVRGLMENAGPVHFIPVLGAFVTPTATVVSTSTAVPTSEMTPTPNVEESPRPTNTRIYIPPSDPTPTPTSTPLSAQIRSDLTLGGVVRVNSNISILPGVTLEILPGTCFQFETAARITVETGARLVARGTSDNPVVFLLSRNLPNWGGIRVNADLANPANQSIFEYCSFVRAREGLFLENCLADVQNCRFEGCFAAITVSGNENSNPRIRSNAFLENQFGIRVNLSGDYGDRDPSDYFSLGIAGERENVIPRNTDPGWNVFYREINEDGVDIQIQNYPINREFLIRLDENIFLLNQGTDTPAIVSDPAELLAGRVQKESAVPPFLEVSLNPAPILENTETVARDLTVSGTDRRGYALKLTDNEVWAGEVNIPKGFLSYEVPAGKQLTILEGTKVRIGKDDSVNKFQTTIQVSGQLMVLGSKDSPVCFESDTDDPTAFDWGGLRFLGPDGGPDSPSRLNFVEICNARIGVGCYGGVHTILNNVILNGCGENGVLASRFVPSEIDSLVPKTAKNPFEVPRPFIQSCLFLGNGKTEYGLFSIDAAPVVRNSVFGLDARRNDYPARPFTRAAIFVSGEDDHVPDFGHLNDPGYNVVAGSADRSSNVFEIVHSSKVSMNAAMNYWAFTNSEEIGEVVFDKSWNNSAGKVFFEPFLTKFPSNFKSHDLDRDGFFLPNDFSVFMQGLLGTIFGSDRYQDLYDIDTDYIIDHNDLFQLALEYGRSYAPPATVVPLPTVTPTPLPVGN